MKMASGVDIDDKSGVGALKAVRCCLHYKYNLVLATYVMALVQNSYSIAVPLGPSVTWTGGGITTWVTPGPL